MDDLMVAAAKVAGSFFGSLLALIYQPPKNWPEFWTRATFSLLSGALFAGPMREFLKWSETIEMYVAAAALVAALSWWAMAALVRIISIWKPK
jgi:hypothetical protein